MRMNIWERVKKIRLRNKILIGVCCMAVILILLFLHSIHFKVGYYFFDFSLDTHDVINFDDYKDDLEVYVNRVDQFVWDVPEFFEDSDVSCYPARGNLVFSKLTGSFSEDNISVPLGAEEWESVINGTDVFPDGEYGTVCIKRDYPDYIFFTAELKERFFVYTGGERPNVLIDSYWEKYEFVRIIKLARGWYDIRPINRLIESDS